MSKSQPTPAQIRSAKIQGMTVEAFVKAVNSLAQSLKK